MSRKLSVTGIMGPDEIEQNFHSSAACSDLVQPRSCTQAAGHTRGLPPASYALCASAVPAAAPTSAQLPDDLDFAVRLSAGLCPGVPLHSVRKWRRSRLRQLKRLVNGVESTHLAQVLEQHKSVSFYEAAPSLQPARLALGSSIIAMA